MSLHLEEQELFILHEDGWFCCYNIQANKILYSKRLAEDGIAMVVSKKKGEHVMAISSSSKVNLYGVSWPSRHQRFLTSSEK